MSPRKPSSPETPTRPRVEGDREQEILDATLEVLVDVGYDRLTMDAVATRAKASKATLYRKWESKATLVIDALRSQKAPQVVVADTGGLRDDLIATFCQHGSLSDQHQNALLGSVVTAIGRDPEFAAAFREQFIAPKVAASRTIYERARDRGEIRDDIDLDILTAALAGIVLHRGFLLGEPPTPDLITRVIDQVILPAATRG
ncbi:TetR/AcrR family transcriptional regulator [Nocardioides carbamazepini]|uniref:TetR/AcrR family transcriptional regulator n=1 Tax=Nocardioides carbamazepini TaxID=2854259 RepID=UPI00214A891D|nr:TetR/AcrR family transcriptional regulator [Nocardioides carbamazepini]MCR1782642.1 TetR/AcrR family transcriptional regulator [Nocardioides carbamazepini]